MPTIDETFCGESNTFPRKIGFLRCACSCKATHQGARQVTHNQMGVPPGCDSCPAANSTECVDTKTLDDPLNPRKFSPTKNHGESRRRRHLIQQF